MQTQSSGVWCLYGSKRDFDCPVEEVKCRHSLSFAVKTTWEHFARPHLALPFVVWQPLLHSKLSCRLKSGDVPSKVLPAETEQEMVQRIFYQQMKHDKVVGVAFGPEPLGSRGVFLTVVFESDICLIVSATSPAHWAAAPD